MTVSEAAAKSAIALVHHPVYDKHHAVIASAVTNLDIHDIARSARTFGLNNYFIVTPLADQAALVKKVTDHWITGWGAEYNAKRKRALELITTVSSIDEAVSSMERHFSAKPLIAVTGASSKLNSISSSSLCEQLEKSNRPLLLVFGTGWGLTEEVFDSADIVLSPIAGNSDYNHLSVRSAVSIYLDRIFGGRD